MMYFVTKAVHLLTEGAVYINKLEISITSLTIIQASLVIYTLGGIHTHTYCIVQNFDGGNFEEWPVIRQNFPF